MDHLLKVVADKRVKIETIKDFTYEPAPVSPSDVPGFKHIITTLRQIYPEAAVAPTIMLSSSDSKNFTLVSSNIYRFAPIVVTSEDMARIHGLNERTKIEDFKKGIGFYYQLIKNSQSQ
jgi:carboxypeptidase PM20D1